MGRRYRLVVLRLALIVASPALACGPVVPFIQVTPPAWMCQSSQGICDDNLRSTLLPTGATLENEYRRVSN